MTIRRMLVYLEKFNKLPQELREKISSPETMEIIDVLEKKYGVSLATVVMRVMVKEISIEDLEKYFVFENELDNHRAIQLAEELLEKIFYNFADYLEIKMPEKKAEDEIVNASSENVAARVLPEVPLSTGFFFSSEDEEEVKELSRKVEGFARNQDISKQNEDKINRKIELIRKQIGINFSSEDLNSRFAQVIKTYLKGVRNKIDTKQTLIKSINTGGLGMDDIFSDNVLIVADKLNTEKEINKDISVKGGINAGDQKEMVSGMTKLAEEKSKTEEKLSPESLKDSGIRDIDYDFSKISQNRIDKSTNLQDESVQISEKEKKPLNLETINLSDVDSKKNQFSSKISNVNKVPIRPKILSDNNGSFNIQGRSIAPEVEKKPTENMVNIRRPINVDGKKRMDDVKYVPKLTGPVEELADMNLINFRRLSQSPVAAANKIKEKLGFLEEEGFDKRLAGIKAWRQSPVNSLYLAIAQESINNKTNIEEIINQRISAGEDSLTNEEIEAIMELNKSLRF